MVARKSFAPDFGPNGAVMNDPGMTGEMRSKIERADPRHPANRLPPAMQWLFAGVNLFSLCLVAIAAILRPREPASAIAIILASAMIIAVNAAWRSLVLRMRRQNA